MEQTSRDVTALLTEIADGKDESLSQLMPIVYAELRRLARHHLRSERSDHTLQTTALVHEVYLLLVRQQRREWRNEAVFLQVAAQMMRRVLVDYARQSKRQKRGGTLIKVSLEDASLFAEDRREEVLVIDEALNRLEIRDARLARVVELRFYGGMTVEETARILNMSPKTVKRDWTVARAWLYGDLRARYGTDSGTMGPR